MHLASLYIVQCSHGQPPSFSIQMTCYLHHLQPGFASLQTETFSVLPREETMCIETSRSLTLEIQATVPTTDHGKTLPKNNFNKMRPTTDHDKILPKNYFNKMGPAAPI